jgi:hypothetical protein
MNFSIVTGRYGDLAAFGEMLELLDTCRSHLQNLHALLTSTCALRSGILDVTSNCHCSGAFSTTSSAGLSYSLVLDGSGQSGHTEPDSSSLEREATGLQVLEPHTSCDFSPDYVLTTGIEAMRASSARSLQSPGISPGISWLPTLACSLTLLT